MSALILRFTLAVQYVFTAFLSGTTDIVTADSWQPLIDAFTQQISVSNIIAVLASVAGVSVGLVFMWWGLRKAISALMAAFKRGKLKL